MRNQKVSSSMRKGESLILHEKPNSFILHKKTKSLIGLILKDSQRHSKTPKGTQRPPDSQRPSMTPKDPPKTPKILPKYPQNTLGSPKTHRDPLRCLQWLDRCQCPLKLALLLARGHVTVYRYVFRLDDIQSEVDQKYQF